METSVLEERRPRVTTGTPQQTRLHYAADSRIDRLFETPVSDTKIAKVQQWYREQLNIDFEALPSWEVIKEMRLVSQNNATYA